LNFDFERFNFRDDCTDSTADRRRCIEVVAIHEFGHALAFEHEHEQADSTCPYGDVFMQDWFIAEGDTPITPYDEHSIMNYCNYEMWYGSPDSVDDWLSSGDASGLAELYGPPPELAVLF
jgi:hypothetical protein